MFVLERLIIPEALAFALGEILLGDEPAMRELTTEGGCRPDFPVMPAFAVPEPIDVCFITVGFRKPPPIPLLIPPPIPLV